MVLARDYKRSSCHSTLYPFEPKSHKLDYISLSYSCVTRHRIEVARIRDYASSDLKIEVDLTLDVR